MSKEFIIETIKEHKDAVNSMIITPNEKYLFSASADGTLKGYWTRSYAFCSSDSHNTELTSIAASPDSTLLATGTMDNKVLIWKYQVVGHVQVLKGHTGPVNSVIFTPDGKHLISGSGKDDNSIRMWDVSTRDLIMIFPELYHEITSLAISPNGGSLLAANGNKIAIFDISTGNLMENIEAHEDLINDIALSPDGSYFISGSADKTLKVWSSMTLKLSMSFDEHDNDVKAVAISPDSKYIVSATGKMGSEKDCIYIWELETGNLIQKLEGHKGSINTLIFSPDGDFLISGSSDNLIIVWDFKLAKGEITLIEQDIEEIKVIEPEKIEKDITIKEYETIVDIKEEKIEQIDEQAMEDIETTKKKVKLYQKLNKVGSIIQKGDYLKAAEKLNKIIKKAKSDGLDDVVNVAQTILNANTTILEYYNSIEMQSIEPIEKLEIPSNKVFYDDTSKRISFNLPYFTFIGHYKKSTEIGKVLDELHTSLGTVQLKRKNIYIVDALTKEQIDETIKIKKLNLLNEEERDKKKEREKLADRLLDQEAPPITEDLKDKIIPAEVKLEKKERKEGKKKETKERLSLVEAEMQTWDERIDYERVSKRRLEKPKSKKKMKAAPPVLAKTPPPSGGAVPTRAPAASEAAPPPTIAFARDIAPIEAAEEEMVLMEDDMGAAIGGEVLSAPQPTVYDINLGLEYYSCMMEKQSYLIYIYFSHEELKIEVEGPDKAVYTTTFQIVTTKKEPPKLDLRVEGEGFEIHPLSGVIQVDKEQINPSLMVFSITALKSKIKKSKKEKKEGEKRYLHIYIDFEGKNVSHSIISILVQPKHFSLDLGPLHLNISKTQAYIVSLIPIFVTVISTIYTLLKLDFSDLGASGGEALGGMLPGAGSLIFLITFLYTLIKKGVFPLKHKVSGFLDFNKQAAILK